VLYVGKVCRFFSIFFFFLHKFWLLLKTTYKKMPHSTPVLTLLLYDQKSIKVECFMFTSRFCEFCFIYSLRLFLKKDTHGYYYFLGELITQDCLLLIVMHKYCCLRYERTYVYLRTVLFNDVWKRCFFNVYVWTYYTTVQVGIYIHNYVYLQ
jgi:hypothetical protein